jgi:hypothetical protein
MQNSWRCVLLFLRNKCVNYYFMWLHCVVFHEKGLCLDSRNFLLLCNGKRHCRVHENPSVCSFLGSLNSFCTCVFSEVHCNIIITPAPSSGRCSLPHACRILCDSIILTIIGEEYSSKCSSYSVVSSYFLVHNEYCIKTFLLQFYT